MIVSRGNRFDKPKKESKRPPSCENGLKVVCPYRELVDNSTDGALTSASAAANASALIDLVGTTLISDSADGALSSAAAATNASISNLHDKVPPFYSTYIVSYFLKNTIGKCKYSFGFCRQYSKKQGGIAMKPNNQIAPELRQPGNSAAMTTPHPDRFSVAKRHKK